MDHAAELSLRMLLRDRALELRAAYQKAREGSPRWSKLDGLYAAASAQLARAGSAEEGQAIFARGIEGIAAIGVADNGDREAERRKPNAADEARLFEHRRQHRIAYAERVSAPVRASVRALKDRLDRISERLGEIDSEVAMREALELYADALRSAGTTIDLAVRESIKRESDAAKAAA